MPARYPTGRGPGDPSVLLRAGVAALVIATGAALPAKAGGAFLVAARQVAPPIGAAGICGRYDWACAAVPRASAAAAAHLAVAQKVNRSVNRRVHEISDQSQYGRTDLWALPTARGGDCEDFALLKKRELIARGVPPDRLLIATVLTARREAHAVLILRTARGDMVLDNLTDRIRPWRDTGYSFLRMQDPAAPSRWQLLLAGGMFASPAG